MTRALALLAAVLSKGAWWAGMLTAGSSDAWGTVALPSDVVAGSSRWALTALGTGLSKPPPWTGLLTPRACPPWGARAGPCDWVAVATPLAGTALLTVSSKRALSTGLGTVGALATRGTEAGAILGVAKSPRGAGTGSTAVQSKEASWAGLLTEGSPPAGQTGAYPTHMVTGSPILTLALLCTTRSEATLGTPALTLQALVAGLTQALSTDGLTAPLAGTAVAVVAAVWSPVPTVTCSLAAKASPPRGTAAVSSHWVAMPVIGA